MRINFEEPWNGKVCYIILLFGIFYGLLEYFMAYWYILWPIGNLVASWYIFWHIVSRKIWQPWYLPWWLGRLVLECSLELISNVCMYLHTGSPDFSWYSILTREKIYRIATTCTKWP
jgi:Zn-dependent protease with chaperone function